MTEGRNKSSWSFLAQMMPCCEPHDYLSFLLPGTWQNIRFWTSLFSPETLTSSVFFTPPTWNPLGLFVKCILSNFQLFWQLFLPFATDFVANSTPSLYLLYFKTLLILTVLPSPHPHFGKYSYLRPSNLNYVSFGPHPTYLLCEFFRILDQFRVFILSIH